MAALDDVDEHQEVGRQPEEQRGDECARDREQQQRACGVATPPSAIQRSWEISSGFNLVPGTPDLLTWDSRPRCQAGEWHGTQGISMRQHALQLLFKWNVMLHCARCGCNEASPEQHCSVTSNQWVLPGTQYRMFHAHASGEPHACLQACRCRQTPCPAPWLPRWAGWL